MKSLSKIRVSSKETITVLIISILLIIVGYCCDKVNSPRMDTEPVANIFVGTEINTTTIQTATTTTTTTTTKSIATTTSTMTTTKVTTTATSMMTTPTSQLATFITAETTIINEKTEFKTVSNITESEYIMLCNCVAYEYGADWIDVAEKAKVVEVIMNRVYSNQFPSTIYEVLTQPYQFSGIWNYVNLGTYSNKVTESVKAAVDYYFANPDLYNHGYIRFEGDGQRNYFYTHF